MIYQTKSTPIARKIAGKSPRIWNDRLRDGTRSLKIGFKASTKDFPQIIDQLVQEGCGVTVAPCGYRLWIKE